MPADIRLDGQGPVVTIRGGEYGVSPGQACVLYEGEGPGQRVLGGGFIAQRLKPGSAAAIPAPALHTRA